MITVVLLWAKVASEAILRPPRPQSQMSSAALEVMNSGLNATHQAGTIFKLIMKYVHVAQKACVKVAKIGWDDHCVIITEWLSHPM